jgi:hypothetical protein
MNRFECMQRLASRLKDELVILSLGASVDEWYNAAPHMRSASLFQQQLGCVTPQAFGLAVGLPHRRIVSLDTDGGMMFNLGILATLANEQPQNLLVVVWDNEATSPSAALRRTPRAAPTSRRLRAAPVSSMPTRSRHWTISTGTARTGCARARRMCSWQRSTVASHATSSANTATDEKTNTPSCGTWRGPRTSSSWGQASTIRNGFIHHAHAGGHPCVAHAKRG